MLVFPSNPAPGDVFAPGPGFPSWVWDGDKWTRAAAAPFSLAGLSDVQFTEPVSAAELLGFSDGAWRNITDLLANTLAVGGDATIHGALTLDTDPVAAMQAATKQYVDGKVAAIPVPDLSTLAGPVTINAPATSLTTLRINGANGEQALAIEGGAGSGQSYGAYIRAGTTAADECFALYGLNWDNFMSVRGDGTGQLGATSGRMMLWDNSGFRLQADPTIPLGIATKQYVDARFTALTVPLAWYFTDLTSGGGTGANIAITMPLYLPAGFAGSQATTGNGPAAAYYLGVYRYWGGASGPWQWEYIGEVAFAAGALVGYFRATPGGGNGNVTLNPGERLQVWGAFEQNMSDVAITIQATRV